MFCNALHCNVVIINDNHNTDAPYNIVKPAYLIQTSFIKKIKKENKVVAKT